MLELSSEKPAVVEPEEEPPPPPPEPDSEPAPEPEVKIEPEPPEDEVAWDEDYDEHIDGEEPSPPRPRKRRRYGGVIVLVVIILFLILWTVLSPKVMPQSGNTYLNSTRYANLGGFAGEIDTWAGNSTWALSVSGSNTTSVGTGLDISVLISKVSEDPANSWFRGTGISFKNVSVYMADGALVGLMSNKSDVGFGLLATVPISFSASGDYELFVYVKFLIYADMRIGFLPMKAVEIESEHFVIHVV